MNNKVYKDACTFDDGYIWNGDVMIEIPFGVWQKLDQLETDLQKRIYLDSQPAAVPAPSLDGFERIFAFKHEVYVACETPLIDQKVEEGKRLFKEIKGQASAKKADEYLANMQNAIEWVVRDYMVVSDEIVGGRIMDWPCLGNPLELTVEDLVKAASVVCCVGDLNVMDIHKVDLTADEDGDE